MNYMILDSIFNPGAEALTYFTVTLINSHY